MKYYIPKYVPIYKSNNKICIGFANKLDRYVEFDYTDDNYNYIEKILVEGTTEITDSSPEILKNLFESNLIELQKVEVYTQRGYLFLEYLKNGNFPLVKDSEILVFGAGGVGGTLIYLLAQFGFTNLHIVDFDEVNDSDVFKLLVYDKEQIGIRKVKALQEKIEKNFGFKINTYESELVEFAHLNQLISAIEPALIVKACDPDLVFRVALNKICYDQKIPHLHIAYSFEDIRIGPLFIPGFMGCDQCLNLSMQEIYGSH